MQVKIIRNFIQAFDEDAYDVQFLSTIKQHFLERKDVDALTNADLGFLVGVFKERWSKVQDTEYDYTFSSEGISLLWITLAKELARIPTLGKDYVEILFDSKHQRDFNNTSLLTETESPDNFFAGHKQGTLFRKRGLYDHLSQCDFVLSTHDSMDRKKLRSLTLDELNRLRRCKKVDGGFSIKKEHPARDESFSSFWDFLRRKCFPQLNPDQKMPLSVLPHLLLLIERYFELKESNSDFSLFQDEWHKFTTLLYQSELEAVNLLYGINNCSSNPQSYLLDVLLEINRADGFTRALDTKLGTVLIRLCQLNPLLSSSSKQLEERYQQSHAEARTDTAAVAVEEHSLLNCKSMLLSLFTLSFEYPLCAGKVIAVCDKKNTVLPLGEHIYERLSPFMTASGNAEDMLASYRRIVTGSPVLGPQRVGVFFRSSPPPEPTWFDHVRNGTLAQMGVQWYEPELLIHKLIHFKGCSANSARLVDRFLNELIRTYNQNISELQKQLRVNILFSELMKSLDALDKRLVILLLGVHSDTESRARSLFVPNCMYHMGKCLNKISAATPSMSFLTDSRTAPRDLNIADYEGITCVNQAIELCSDAIQSFPPEVLGRLIAYLCDLRSPILTDDDHQTAKNSAGSMLDNLGAPT